jgi:hypothetical protein
MSKYKLIQLTNKNIGEFPVDSYLPLGLVTRRLNAPNCNCDTFQITSSTSDTIMINEPGYYKVTYSLDLVAADAGVATVTLVTNQQNIYTTSETVAAAEDVVDLDLTYVLRVCPNCCSAPYNCPISLQLQLGGVASSATTPSVSNLIIEKLA